MARRSVFIAATGQHVGKTTTSIGLVAGLQKRVSRVGFLKPVGSEHETILCEDGSQVKVDRDARMIKSHFGLEHFDDRDASPLVLGAAATRNFLDGETESLESMRKRVQAAFERVAVESDYVVIEGTGHMGVGSIVRLNNATVAKMLGVDVVLVASGGVGSAFDEIALNMQLCQAIGVRVRGVVLNKVHEEKIEMITRYMSKALSTWGVPLMGCIPRCTELASPSLRHLKDELGAETVSGEEHYDNVFTEQHLVATSLDQFYKLLHNVDTTATLLITPAARTDVIQGAVAKWAGVGGPKGGLVLTGKQPLPAAVVARLQKADIPAIYCSKPTYQVMTSIINFTPKTGSYDTQRILRASELVENNVDIDRLLGPSEMMSMACMPDLQMWQTGDFKWQWR